MLFVCFGAVSSLQETSQYDMASDEVAYELEEYESRHVG
jgi:hypothetical protein